jgi:hypothetical protein
VLEHLGRQAQATGGQTSAEIHDIVGNDEHVVVLGSAKASARDGPAPSGSTPRSSTSGMGMRPRSGGWPRTTPPSTPSWTTSPTERRPTTPQGRPRFAAARAVAPFARRVPLRGGRNGWAQPSGAELGHRSANRP